MKYNFLVELKYIKKQTPFRKTDTDSILIDSACFFLSLVYIMAKSNIAFIDDHSLVLQGINSSLKNIPFFHNISLFAKPRDLMTHLSNTKVDLIVTDIKMPEQDGYSIVRTVKKIQPEIKIAILTQFDGEGYFQEAYRLGINAYILKSESHSFFPEILNRILNGEFYISPELNKYLRSVQSSIVLDSLEHDIVKLLIQGMSLKEISISLNCSHKIIEYRIKKIRRIFDSKTTAELMYKIRQEYLKE